MRIESWYIHIPKEKWSRSVVSDSLQPCGLQYARLLSPSLSLGACSNSCPLSQWCHSTLSPSVVPFSSYPQSFPASGSFSMSQLFASGGQSIGASASVLPMNIQDWFHLVLTSLISLLSLKSLGVRINQDGPIRITPRTLPDPSKKGFLGIESSGLEAVCSHFATMWGDLT